MGNSFIRKLKGDLDSRRDKLSYEKQVEYEDTIGMMRFTNRCSVRQKKS